MGTTPWFDCNTSYTGKISNHIGINAIVLSDVVKGLLVVLDFLWIETVNPDREWRKQVTGRKIISQIDAIETSGFHTNNSVFELMVML